MKAHIERDPLLGTVKVWLYRREDYGNGTVFMWPTKRNEMGDMEWMQEIVADGAVRPEHIKPALEMSGQMWKPFIEAIRAQDGEVPAGKLLFTTLEREQNRVDALIQALIKSSQPQLLFQSEPMKGP